MTLFRSQRTAVHLVTVLEEMPVQETADGIAELREAGSPSAASSSTWSGRRTSTPKSAQRPLERQDRPRRARGRLKEAGVEVDDDAGRRPARRGPRPRRAARARGLPARAGRGARRAVVRAPAAAGRRRPRRALRAGRALSAGRHEAMRMATTHQSSRASARSPPVATTSAAGARHRRSCSTTRHRDHRVLRLGRRRQDHDLGRAGAARRRARPQGRRAHHRPGPPAGPVDGDRGARQHAAAGARQSTAEAGGSPRRDDARHEAHLRRGGARARPPPRRRSRSWRTPSTSRCPARSRAPRSTWRWRSSGSSTDAAEDRRLRPDRRRHPAVPVGAGLPRRARAALELPRRPVHPAAAGAGPRPGAADDGRVSGWSRTRMTKVLGAQVLRDMQTFVAAFDTLFGGFRQRAQKTFELLQADGRRSSWSRRRSRTRCARRRTSSSGSARTGCRWPGWSSTAPRRRRRRPVGRRGDGRRRRDCASRRPRPWPAGLLRLHADRAGWSSASSGCATASRPRTPTVPTAVVPALAGRRARPGPAAPGRRAARRDGQADSRR